MSDILDRLRGYADSRLYALPGQYVCDVPEILNEHAELVTRLLTAERERDEARRERDAVRKQYAMSLEEQVELVRQREDTSSQLWDCMNERDAWKHRAERAERVVEAAKRFDAAWHIASVTDEGLGLPPLLRCVPEIRSLCEAVRALDAAQGDG